VRREGHRVARRDGDVLGEPTVGEEAVLRARGRAQVLVAAQAVGAAPAADVVVQDDTLPDARGVHARPGGRDDAHDLVPQREWSGPQVQEAGEEVQFGVAEAGRADAHEHLAGAGRGARHVLEPEGLSGTMVADCLHECSSS